MTTTLAPERDRASIADKYKWDLSDLFPDEAAWNDEKRRVAADVPGLRAWRGQLTTSASLLADALEARTALRRAFARLHVYASMLSDQDTRDSGTRA